MRTELIHSNKISCGLLDSSKASSKFYHKTKLKNYLGQAINQMALFIKKDFSGKSTLKGKSLTIGLMVCGEKRIRSLNRDHRQKDKITDVLSFPGFHNLRKGMRKDEFFFGTELNLGDIVICKEVAKRQAKEIGHSMEKELVALFIHGFLHVLGFDHEISKKEEKLMFALEDKILSAIKWEKK